ncbi:hypothetical protein QA597_00325 [Marinilabiliaceae bacterium ANBcel2]|nr:hypothetical protein [Marinilabiliaceae bacterium ANBcel2]
MIKIYLENRDVVVFSRWSRRSYAIFSSLKKTIHIAQLSFDVCEASLLKNNRVISILQKVGFAKDDDIVKDDDDFFNFWELVLFFELLFVDRDIEVYISRYKYCFITYAHVLR